MRVFLTGGSGFIGSAIVLDLLSMGHSVLGLARSADTADALTKLGAVAHQGDLSDHASISEGVSACDGVIHTAFGHDFSKYKEAGETDRRVVETMAHALEGSGKPLVITSGTVLLAAGRIGVETDAGSPESSSAVRLPSENVALLAADRGVRSSIVRLAPSVHGRGDHGFVPALIALAREKGFSAYVGDGLNRWPAIHRLDAARLFCLALQKAAPGSRLHGAAEEGITMREIADAIGRGLELPVRSIGADEAEAHFDWLAIAVPLDNPTSSALTRHAVGWDPCHPGLLDDLRKPYYFDA